MLGQQSSFLHSSISSSGLNASSLGIATSAQLTNPSQTSANSPLQSSGLDDKSLKDIIQILNKCVEKTKHLTELSQVLQVESIDSPSISGHTDFFYPSLVYQIAQYQQELPEINKVKRMPIPNELIEQFNQMQYSCFMGLFTCISRAWLTIDNLIFFWNYEDGSDICFYDNLTEPILAVELFQPRPDTFDEGIEYALCLATNTSVVLLSIDFIRFTKGNGAIINELKFSPQPVYSIPTDASIINTIKASKKTGRLFMGAKDGCLYEFFYQNQSSWFSSQTKKINLSQSKFHYFVPSFFSSKDADSIIQIELDESRNVLYTRSENSTIQVFYLGPNGQETSKISYLTMDAIATKAAALINTNDKNLFAPIVHISAIKKSESKNITLVAVTKSGIRAYFSLNPFDTDANQQMVQTIGADGSVTTGQYLTHSNQPLVPAVFQLVHVRIPPNIELSGANRNMNQVTSGFIHDGVTLLISKRDENNDSVLFLNRDLFSLHSNFKESKSLFDVDGRVWCVDEIVPSLSSIKSCAFENDLLQTIKSASGVDNIPKLTADFFDCPRRFVMITPQGCYIWSKLRPVDQLYFVLKESNGPNSDGVRLFFNRIYERPEACALCLAVALLHSHEPRIYEWATHAFFIYSGEPEIKKRNALSVSYAQNPSNVQYQQSHHHQQQQQQQQQHFSGFGQAPSSYAQYQQFNAQSSLISESGVEPPETSMYADMTLIHNQPYRHNKPNFASMTYMNSPQQMSTPIAMRTKDQFNGTYQAVTQERVSLGQQSFAQRPSFQPQQPQQQQQQQNQLPSSQPQLPQLLDQSRAQHLLQSECEIHFSGKHDAIYLYLSRLLTPIWDLKLLCDLTPGRCLDDEGANSDEPLSFATFTQIDLQWFLNKLNELRRFLDVNFAHLKNLKYSYLTPGLFGQSAQTGTPGNVSQSAQNQPRFATQIATMPINLAQLVNLTASNLPGSSLPQISEEKLAIEIENGSIYLIKQFLNRMVEIFGLWKILDDHKYHFVSSKLDEQTQLILMRMQIKQFLFAENSLLEKLITALLYRYIDDNACTDLLNQSLKQMCPSLYSNENAIYSKACEKLKQALNIKNDNYEKDRLLNEAVDLMKQIGYVANLGQVCETLQAAGCYEAIFELCLTAAEKRDPQNIALYYYRKCEPPEDLQGQQYFQLRSECYKCMLECFNALIKTPSVSMQTSGASQRAVNTRDKIEEQISFLIKYIIGSKDELAHVSLFNWMIGCGLEKKLVTLDSPFLEHFLVREIKDQVKNRVYLDLLWRHYDYRKDYQNAAKVLTALAEKYSESQITLKERVEYLAQAIVALNSIRKVSVKDQLADLEDKKDVALMQEKIYVELSQIEPRTDLIQEALVQLDSQLYDITKLYYDFAEKFELNQCQLAIFKISRHDEPKMIEVFWKKIIANELEKVSTPDIKPSELKNQLADNIVNIAKEYVDDEKYFPLVTLIDSLEFVSLSRGFEPEWAPTLLRKLNLPFKKLIEAYISVYSRKDIKWTENSSRFINTIYSLIEIFTRAPNATNETDKVYFLRIVKDLIPKYMTELNTINDDLSRELITRFKTLSFMLERM